jgi:hypothetical protein
MASDSATKTGNIAIYIVMAAALMGVGGGSALLYRHYGAPLFEPPKPARVDAKIIQDAWINVAPSERFVAAKAMKECLPVAKTGEITQEDTLRSQARACEIKILRDMPKEREAALEAAKRRFLVTQGFWPDERMLVPADYAPLAPPPSPKPVNRWDKFGTPELVAAVWRAGANTEKEKAVSTFLSDCLKLEALEGVNVPLLHKRADHCEALSAASATLDVQARNKVVTHRDATTQTYWLGGKPQIMTAETQAGTAPVVVAREPLSRATVEKSWRSTTDGDQLVAASDLSRCLADMSRGQLNAAVLVCELRAMNTGNHKAVDAVLARRAKEIPEIKGPGARYTGEPSTAAPAPAAIPSAVAASAPTTPPVAPVAGKMADGLPGADTLFDGWKKAATDAGTPQVADMLIACMKNTQPISNDARGLRVSADVCKLSVQVQIEKQAQASKLLLDLGDTTP